MLISQADWDAMVAHARDEAPKECCGYARMRDGRVEAVVRGKNLRDSRYAYEIDTGTLYQTYLDEENGFDIAAYHSHPKSPAKPSETDINLAEYPHWLYVIVSLEAEPDVRAWRIVDGKVEEEDVTVE